METNQEETEFLKNYRADDYPRPSVTADVVVLTMDGDDNLSVLLVRRAGHPYKDKWALPGGFLQAGRESTEETARRELFEETGIRDLYLNQLYTFSEPKRDPRTHVVSVAYTALVPKGTLTFRAGDDAKDAELFRIRRAAAGLELLSDGPILTERDLAFDHAEILKLALARLKNRIDYETDAFELLEDDTSFTVYELQKIHEAIKDKALDPSNFRKMFLRNYLRTGIVLPLDKTRQDKGRKEAALFKINTERKERI